MTSIDTPAGELEPLNARFGDFGGRYIPEVLVSAHEDLERAYEEALKYSRVRKQFGKPICEFQAVAFKLADMRVKLDAARLMVDHVVRKMESGQRFTREASQAKLFASEAANWVADQAVQIHGGYGYMKEYPVERYFRDARITEIYEGTSEAQRIVISRQILAD